MAVKRATHFRRAPHPKFVKLSAMLRSLFSRLAILLTACHVSLAFAEIPFEDSMAQRTQACVACHGKQGRAGPDGYYPRLAGKPVGYLYNQLLNFRDGRRHYGLMTNLVTPLTDVYLMEIAQYFSALDVPYPAPTPTNAPKAVLERGRQLVAHGDTVKKIPACTQCHGQALTGVAPHVPGLLGLPLDYLNAQLGAWQTRQRQTQAPDCMAHIAQKLSQQDVVAVANWLSSQPLPANTKPASSLPLLVPGAERLRCGSAQAPSAGSNAVTPTVPAKVSAATSDLVNKGAYLAKAGNCMSCHTVSGGQPFAGGRAIPTPFGVVFSSNLTTDTSNGIGNWSRQDFWQAMHHGRSKDGRLLNPAFPYTSFTHVTRADSDALFAYLQTVAPSPQPNKAHALGWPLGTQAALFAWRTLYFSPIDYQRDDSRSAEWNRGAYLVRGLGHCSACHTPRNAFGASKPSMDLAGGMLAAQNWYAPSLQSSDEAGLTEANTQAFITLMKTGVHAGGAVTGPMAEVVQHSTQYLSTSDLSAMGVFLRALATPSPSAATSSRPGDITTRAPETGAKLYGTHCAQCHGKEGEGVRNAYPPLAKNRNITLANPSNLVQTVLYGGFAPATSGNPRPFGMPPYVLQMNDKETAVVLTYIRNAWGNQAAPVTELEVNRARERP